MAGDLLAELEQISQRQHMSYALWWQTLEDMAQGLNEPCLGLEVGRRVSVAQCGVLGYLFRTSRNALEALSCFKRFERLIYAGSQVRTEQDTHTLALVWDPEHGYSSQLSDELLLAAMVNVVREIMSPSPFDPVAVNFTQALPIASRARYEDFFACEVKEKQARLSIVFKLETLLQPIPYRDEQLHQLLDQQAEAQLSTLPADDVFLETFRDTVLRALHEGRPEAEYVAQQLNMSSRTLHRNLQQRNKLYREELRELRQTMAQRYLRDKKLTLSEIALLLGYAEQSVFTRAFKQWFDQSPAQWRKQYCS
ncbi:MAG: AraC family transcriptional regulator ligand-binding domain-containing protein [Oleiphilaceae bacterium]|nr:AraC family transcriptional regulator ligand-binding domain-containing protein [Oleiphilaceae bacterium]